MVLFSLPVVLSGFQRYFCMQYTTTTNNLGAFEMLFYQDFKDTFVCNTQQSARRTSWVVCCFIRISKILLYAIHNSGCFIRTRSLLFYQDFKDTFVCNTQLTLFNAVSRNCCFIRISKILLYAIHNSFPRGQSAERVVLSGFQRYFCMQYTTGDLEYINDHSLFYQDFKDTFVCNTQLSY